MVVLVKGQRVYRRAHLHTVHTRDGWYRKGRALADADAPPAKRLKKAKPPPQAARGGGGRGGGGGRAGRGRAAAAAAPNLPLTELAVADAAAEGAGEEEEQLFYGEWQTVAYVPPAAVDGKVPRSAHGHVELWTEAHLPAGTTRLRVPQVAQAARQLGLDCAPAMVGFEIKDGRPVPKFDGVVVCSEHAEILTEAAAGMHEANEDRRLRKRRAELLGLWRSLLTNVAVRARVQAQYGGGP